MAKRTYVYTSVSAREAEFLVEMVSKELKSMNILYKLRQKKFELETEKFILVCAPLVASNCLPYKKCNCLVLDIDSSRVRPETLDRIRVCVFSQIRKNTPIIDKNDFLKNIGVKNEENTDTFQKTV